ncbi:DNA primase [Methylocella silvestris BL2]|uniref:DNA primase n=1 Tax=Methylocella silvestris (strain DSM 15510 / CIP 108128 / LMG 27833 / NCIMB 13906 / BL2) TaxID=395965 RepID=B8EK34_METSB|nr:DNA primase [Methylocella silvestris]ACK50574.1 DNA primase [Methylocella silvestris BL2]
MRFSPSFLDDVKARLPVSEVVRRRVKLIRAGREWKGLSPFNTEKTPSFFVNDQKMAWFDLSAGKNGNIFDFVMETEGLSFREAVERLAAEAGVPLPQASPEAEAQEQKRAGLHETLGLAADFFCAQLAGPSGGKARDYLTGRALSAEAQKNFRIGYAPADKFALRDHLAGKGVARDTMIEAGLLIHGEDIAVPYDRFRDRIIFPICDRSGRPIAFGGRALSAEAQPKYLNSPETTLFHKGGVLFNHHRARTAAHSSDRIIVVEGYVDVIALSEAGFAETVAPLGTALTPDQAELLWQMTAEPILCFDGDKAGRKAAYRAIDMALPLIGAGRSLRFALLPEGQDPDDLIRSAGPHAMADVLSQALPLADLIWRRETEGADFSTPERRAGFERRLDEIAQEIRDETLRRYYRDEFRQRRQSLFAPQRSTVKAPWREGSRPAQGARRGFGPGRDGFQTADAAPVRLTASPSLAGSALMMRSGASGLPPREALILLILISHPGLIEQHLEDIADIEFSGRDAGVLRDRLIDKVSSAPLDPAGARAFAQEEGFGAVLARLDAFAAHASHWYMKENAAEADADEVLKQALTLHHKERGLNKDLRAAQQAFERDMTDVNLARLKAIREDLNALGGTEATVEGFGALSGRQSGSL